MPDENEVVKEDVSATSEQPEQTTPVDQQETDQASEQVVQEETVEQVKAQTPQPEYLDDRGVPWKNVAMESQRKLEDAISRLEKLGSQGQQGSQEKEMTIEQLENIALERPDLRPQVEARKAEIIQKNFERSQEKRMQEMETKQRDLSVRQQTENWVVSHPEFKDCFIDDPMTGGKAFNPTNPLAQTILSAYNQFDPISGRKLSDRPDGLRIAAELSLARMYLNNKSKTNNQITQLKRDLKKTQKQAMVVGGGAPAVASKVSEIRKSLDNYQKTNSSKDAFAAVKSLLHQQGILKEE